MGQRLLLITSAGLVVAIFSSG